MDTLELHDKALEKELTFDEEMDALEDLTRRLTTKPAPVDSGMRNEDAQKLPEQAQRPTAQEDSLPSRAEVINAWSPSTERAIPSVLPRPYWPTPTNSISTLNPLAPPFYPQLNRLSHPNLMPGFRAEPKNKREARYFMHLELVRARNWSKRSLYACPSSKQRRQAKRAAAWRNKHR